MGKIARAVPVVRMMMMKITMIMRIFPSIKKADIIQFISGKINI